MTQAKTNFLPELLAPAGSPDALAAAIEGGADAVYFGSVKFSARMRAKNFDENEITDAVALCRAYGVRSYITVNTRVRDTEMDEVMDTVARLYEAGGRAARIRHGCRCGRPWRSSACTVLRRTHSVRRGRTSQSQWEIESRAGRSV